MRCIRSFAEDYGMYGIWNINNKGDIIMKKEIIMPKIGLDMEEGTINKWLKKVGDHMEAGESILEIGSRSRGQRNTCGDCCRGWRYGRNHQDNRMGRDR